MGATGSGRDSVALLDGDRGPWLWRRRGGVGWGGWLLLLMMRGLNGGYQAKRACVCVCESVCDV